MRCSIVVVGDEILAGHVTDANAPFLLERVVANGHSVERIVIVGDDPRQIAADVRAALEGPSGLVIVCGGLGPTHDDKTMEGVGLALDRPLVECPPLAVLIDAVLSGVERSGFSPTSFGAEGFRKMALAPEGAEFLRCSIGVVPAVAIEEQRGVVIVLPGPPRELRAVFMESVEPRYLVGSGRSRHSEEITHLFPEAALAALLTELQTRHPAASIGSYPRPTDALIRITGEPEEVVAIAAAVRAYIEEMAATDEGSRLIAFMTERRAMRSGAESG